MSIRLTALLLTLAGVAHAQTIDSPTLTDDETKKLEAGEVVIHEKTPTDDRGVSLESFGVIDAPTSELWPIIRDCEDYVKFLPNLKATSKKEEDGQSLCFDEISLPFPFSNLWADTRSTVVYDEATARWQRSWELVRGTYRRNRGSWTLIPWGADQKKTLVVYFIDLDPSISIPDFIIRAAQSGSLPKVFTGIRERVKTLRASK